MELIQVYRAAWVLMWVVFIFAFLSSIESNDFFDSVKIGILYAIGASMVCLFCLVPIVLLSN